MLGDVIDDGDRLPQGKHQTPRQWRLFAADFGLDGTDGLLNYPVFETWGNHDGPPEGREKFGFSFQAQLKQRNLARQRKGWLNDLSTNSLFYSWQWDDVHFVMMGIYPADGQNPQLKRYSAAWHDPQGSLAFLKENLARCVGASGRPVVLLSHCGFDTDWWHPDDWKAFYEAVRPYKVVLFLYGHTGTGLRTWAPTNGDPPLQCVNTGQTEKGFFVVNLGSDRLRLAYRIKDWREEKSPDRKVAIRWDGAWEWKYPLQKQLPPAAAVSAPGAGTPAPTGASTPAPAPNQTPDFTGLRGANYVPSYARNDVQLWMDYDAAVINRELGYAKKLGLNSVRVFLQFAVYERDPKLFRDRFEDFLRLCGRQGIQMMPVLFDSCFGEFPDLEKYRDRDWMACPGQNRLGTNEWPKLEEYVRDIVGTHKDDQRIVMWDVMNEPTCTSFYKADSDKRLIHEFLLHFLDYVKAQQPSQPRTVGLMSSSELPLVQERVDVLGFHNYTRELREDIRRVREMGRKLGKPVILNEVVMRPQQPFDLAMPILREEKIGWVFWELMLGKTQFSRGVNPIQGIVYPDGTCRDAREIAAVMSSSLEAARELFPERPPPVVEEDRMTFRGFWTRWTGDGPQKGRLFYSTRTNDTATFPFTGPSVTLVHKVGPDCGIVRVLLDGQPAARPEVDTFSPAVEWNHRTVLAADLPEGRHTVVLQPTGHKNPQSSNCYVQIVACESISSLPGLRRLMDTPLRDTSICRSPDGTWYLTGTVEPFWAYNEGIKLWKSRDLTNWTSLGFVWKYGASPWHKPYLDVKKPLWAPEVHYLKGTFWLTYSLPGWDGTGKTSGCGLLKSASGKPEGPYEDVQPGERLGDEIDASLFQDDDGAVYFLWHSGKIARMKPDMSGLAEPYRWLRTTTTDPDPQHHSGLCAGIFGKDSFDHVGYEGMFLFKANGLYHLCCSENFHGRYSCTISTSTNLYGPYGARYEAIPHGGHNMFLKDEKGQWWSSYFGSDGGAPWQERAGVLPFEFDPQGRVRPQSPPL